MVGKRVASLVAMCGLLLGLHSSLAGASSLLPTGERVWCLDPINIPHVISTASSLREVDGIGYTVRTVTPRGSGRAISVLAWSKAYPQDFGPTCKETYRVFADKPTVVEGPPAKQHTDWGPTYLAGGLGIAGVFLAAGLGWVGQSSRDRREAAKALRELSKEFKINARRFADNENTGGGQGDQAMLMTEALAGRELLIDYFKKLKNDSGKAPYWASKGNVLGVLEGEVLANIANAWPSGEDARATKIREIKDALDKVDREVSRFADVIEGGSIVFKRLLKPARLTQKV